MMNKYFLYISSKNIDKVNTSTMKQTPSSRNGNPIATLNSKKKEISGNVSQNKDADQTTAANSQNKKITIQKIEKINLNSNTNKNDPNSSGKTLGGSKSVKSIQRRPDKFIEMYENQKNTPNSPRPMNKAEIYQAMRRAHLRSNYMNRDLNIKNYIAGDQLDKFQPYFQDMSRKVNNSIMIDNTKVGGYKSAQSSPRNFFKGRKSNKSDQLSSDR